MRTDSVAYTPAITDLARTAYTVVAAYREAQGVPLRLWEDMDPAGQAIWASRVSLILAYSGETAQAIQEDQRAQGLVKQPWDQFGREQQIEAELTVAVVRGMTG
jgi:hypothetical protein